MLGDAKGGWVNYRRSQLVAKKSGQRDASATANFVVLILPTKSWIESGYVRYETSYRQFPAFLPPVPYWRPGSGRVRPSAGEQDLIGQADIENLVHIFFVNP
jgi:hypothetical protein